MDPEKRIADLEKQVEDLRDLVGRLRTDGAQAHHRHPLQEATERLRQTLAEDFLEFSGGRDEGEQASGDVIESRIGSVWIGRIGVLLLLTAIVVGARVTVYTEALGAVQKLVVAYALSLLAVVYGLIPRDAMGAFSKTILAAGLAGIYFATYGAFYVPGLQVFARGPEGIPALAACLLLVTAVAHRQRSETAGAISIFLIYYTVFLSCMDAASKEDVAYALITCALLLGAALLFHIQHRWLFVSWLVLVASYGSYALFFRVKPPELALTSQRYFLLSYAFLALSFVIFCLICVVDVWRYHRYRRALALFCLANAAAFTWLGLQSVGEQYPDMLWIFRLGLAGALALWAVLANLVGARHNYVTQLFVSLAALVGAMALRDLLSIEWFVMALALSGILCGLAFSRTGLVLFKTMNLFVLAGTGIGCFLVARADRTVTIGQAIFPADWVCVGGTAVALCLVAAAYEHFAVRRPAHTGLLRRSVLDVHPTTVALAHSAAAAFLLLVLTVTRLADMPLLPFYLVTLSVGMATLGLLLRAPQIEASSVLLLTAGHMSFYIFLYSGIAPDFEEQELFALYTLLTAAYTFFAGYLWEKYLRRLDPPDEVEHHAIACIPDLAATLMLSALAVRFLPESRGPLVHNAFAVALIAVGLLGHFTSLAAGGVLALGVGSVLIYRGIAPAEGAAWSVETEHWPLWSALALYIAAERTLAWLHPGHREPSRAAHLTRWVIVLLGTALGLAALYRIPGWQHYLTLRWMLYGLGLMALGVLVRERCYRWASLVVLVATAAWAVGYDWRTWSPLHQVVFFGGLGAAFLGVAWAYAHFSRGFHAPTASHE